MNLPVAKSSKDDRRRGLRPQKFLYNVYRNLRYQKPRYLGFVAFLLWSASVALIFSRLSVIPCRRDNDIHPQQAYRGKQYWKEGVTLSVETIYESPFARFQKHTIQLDTDGVSEKKTIIRDWLWFDEPENINVLVQDREEKFWILGQSKYGIQEPTTYATVGGLIEADDASPLAAAQREVREELQVHTDDWISLGHYVAAANRGGGITHTFWARNVEPIKTNLNGDADKLSRGGVAVGELERQTLLRLTKAELIQALFEGKFKEVKWTATAALALLHENYIQSD